MNSTAHEEIVKSKKLGLRNFPSRASKRGKSGGRTEIERAMGKKRGKENGQRLGDPYQGSDRRGRCGVGKGGKRI